jgi:hypothetical protein
MRGIPVNKKVIKISNLKKFALGSLKRYFIQVLNEKWHIGDIDHQYEKKLKPNALILFMFMVKLAFLNKKSIT